MLEAFATHLYLSYEHIKHIIEESAKQFAIKARGGMY
jgi:hypothetical protein